MIKYIQDITKYYDTAVRAGELGPQNMNGQKGHISDSRTFSLFIRENYTPYYEKSKDVVALKARGRAA